MTLLSLKDVSVRFGGLVAVDGLSTDIPAGEVRGLIGPNGSGKTTTINAISGFYKPASGSIKLESHELVGLPPHEAAAHGMARTFQNLRVFPNLTVLENHDVVIHPRRVKEEEKNLRQRARAIASDMGLRGQEDTVCKSLPYGRRRLVEIGRALMSRPKFIMLDEPTVGMTAEEIEQVKNIIFQLKKNMITVLIVGHDMKIIMSVCDCITVLNYGKKIAEGPSSEIQSNSQVIEAYLGAGEEDA
jgi:branched-chain amino acid transport system ATP-binding protein